MTLAPRYVLGKDPIGAPSTPASRLLLPRDERVIRLGDIYGNRATDGAVGAQDHDWAGQSLYAAACAKVDTGAEFQARAYGNWQPGRIGSGSISGIMNPRLSVPSHSDRFGDGALPYYPTRRSSREAAAIKSSGGARAAARGLNSKSRAM